LIRQKLDAYDVPSLSKKGERKSSVSGSSLHGTEKQPEVLKGKSSRLGDKRELGKSESSSLSLGKVSSISKTKYILYGT